MPGSHFFKRYGKFIYPLLIAATIYLFLDVCLGNQFTNWDDNDYVTGNNLIKDTSPEGIKRLFALNTIVQGNYHPLTMLSLALDYRIGQMDPMVYHLSSLLFHILASVLVYVFVNKLTGMRPAALIAGLLFGLHPMHMESVAWVSGRKDVVYGTFYVASLIAYLYYLSGQGYRKALWFSVVLITYFLSLLSKPSAVVLPLSLLVIDLFQKRKLSIWPFIEKIPFFALSLLFGLKSVMEQDAYGAVNTDEFNYTFFERLAMGGHALFTYLYKALFPTNLRAFYQYPAEVEWYSLWMVLLLAALVLVYGRKNRWLLFGLLFFLVNIGLLLQFIPVGAAIVAERYTYIPYIGLFTLAGMYVQKLVSGSKSTLLVYTVSLLCVLYIGILGQQAANRCRVWRDNISLWNDEIEKEPRFYGAYNNLGYYYYQLFDTCTNAAVKQVYFDSSLQITSKAVELNPDLPVPYTTLGELERYRGNFTLAKSHYLKGMLTGKENKEYALVKANIGLGILYGMSNVLDSTYHYLAAAYKLAPNNVDVHNNLGNYYALKGQSDSAIRHYGTAMKLDPKAYSPYLNRGRVYQQQKRHPEAIRDFDRAAALRPDLGEILYTRSSAHYAVGNTQAALNDADNAIRLGYRQIDTAYYNALKRR